MRTERVVSRFVFNGLGSHNRVIHVAMDKQAQSVDPFECSLPGNAAFVAKSIQADFTNLLRIFSEQLAGLPNGHDDIRPHIEEARSAAARGLQLSERLIATLNDQPV